MEQIEPGAPTSSPVPAPSIGMATDEIEQAVRIEGQCMAHFVLVAGEAAEWQGGPPHTREFQHTSLGFVGEAYEQLRSGGVPRRNIIVIAQLSDYLSVLGQGQAGTLDTGIPQYYYGEQRERTVAQCRRLLDEGGAHYDGAAVNPGTIWSVLLGEAEPAQPGPVVPADSDSALVFAIYSHGDRHSTTELSTSTACTAAGATSSDTAAVHEWYAHFPYETTRTDLYDMVATEHAPVKPGGGFGRYLYSTQLRQIFHNIFDRQPQRPVIGLLNYCLSGGNLDFMRRDAVRVAFGVDKWPLYLMSSSQAETESMVGGLWSSWFEQLGAQLTQLNAPSPEVAQEPDVHTLFCAAEAAFFQENLYELVNAVKARIYAPTVWELEFEFGGRKGNTDPWHVDLKTTLSEVVKHMCHGAPAEPSAVGDSGDWLAPVVALQKLYESGEAFRIMSAEEFAASGLATTDGTARAGHTTDRVVWMCESQRERAMGYGRALPVKLVAYAGTQEKGLGDLATEVQYALGTVSRPESVHGISSGIDNMPLRRLIRGDT